MADLKDHHQSSRREVSSLAGLCGLLYFVQGIAEPTEGLIAQPVRSMLRGWQHTATDIAAFGFWLSLPWMIKPLYGLIVDYVPLFGRRHKSYLVLMNFTAAAGLLALYVWPPPTNSTSWLFALLFAPTLAVAFADVVIDAWMVERGQPLKITGQLQSVQWGAMYGAMILTGHLGGQLSQSKRQDLGFLICGLVTVVALIAALFWVREPRATERHTTPKSRDTSGNVFAAATELWRDANSPAMLAIGGFLFLWNFNPFSSAVLQQYMATELKFDEQFIGHTYSLQAIASLVACCVYGATCRRFSTRTLTHLSILLGIVSTLGYWQLCDKRSAVAISLAIGFTYMIATLIQMDLAARVCPPGVAGTMFALLMALSNAGITLSQGLGGFLYDHWSAQLGSTIAAFERLVLVGAACTACCWLLMPWWPRSLRTTQG